MPTLSGMSRDLKNEQETVVQSAILRCPVPLPSFPLDYKHLERGHHELFIWVSLTLRRAWHPADGPQNECLTVRYRNSRVSIERDLKASMSWLEESKFVKQRVTSVQGILIVPGIGLQVVRVTVPCGATIQEGRETVDFFFKTESRPQAAPAQRGWCG